MTELIPLRNSRHTHSGSGLHLYLILLFSHFGYPTQTLFLISFIFLSMSGGMRLPSYSILSKNPLFLNPILIISYQFSLSISIFKILADSSSSNIYFLILFWALVKASSSVPGYFLLIRLTACVSSLRFARSSSFVISS